MDSLLEFIKNYEDGVTEEQIRIMNPSLSKESLVEMLNTFINSNKITVYKKDSAIFYKYTAGTSDDYESLLLNLISQGGTEGLWFKEIKDKTNMPHNLAMKVLRSLENKRLIKSMKCIKSNRKVYVLYDLVPSDDITGGFWFNDNDVDGACVESVYKIVYQFITQSTLVEDKDCINKYSNNPTVYSILDYINTLKILTSEIKECDLKVLLDIMAYDNKIEKLIDGGIERYTVVNKK
ncbi:putative DNA-directed RNA polymerase III subunit rpc6 [Nosema granulosis]|uniref:DNA-directed RNA polymerase III subunit rpc6 n=1 Tax=Nosema granulosis TaxID=83296 RepID=A0A9P6H1P5_9MICR|nr:putative DNA-directed RNA polymerase III subunit rpc6 [Nosema granulosis]